MPHAVLVENLAIQAEFGGHFARALGQAHGGQQIGRFVGQAAGEVLRFSQNAAAIQGRLRCAQNGKRIHVLLVLFRIGLVAIRFEIGQNGAFHCGGGEFVGSKRVIQGQRDAANFFALEQAERGAGHLAKLRGVEFIPLAAAGQHQTLGLETGGPMEDGYFTRLSGELAGVIQFLHLVRCSRRRITLESHQHQCIGFHVPQSVLLQGLSSFLSVTYLGSVAADGCAGFGFHLAFAFGLAFVVQFLALGHC